MFSIDALRAVDTHVRAENEQMISDMPETQDIPSPPPEQPEGDPIGEAVARQEREKEIRIALWGDERPEPTVDLEAYR